MTTLASPSSAVDISEIEWVERDLFDRLDMLPDDVDAIVVLGMVAAGVVDVSVLADLFDDDNRIRPSFSVDRSDVPAEHFARFQRLWYHFRVPYARASLVWWHVFCLAMREDDRVSRATERMGERLGELAGPPGAVLPVAGHVLGLRPAPVVVTADETADVAALATAVRLAAPLVAVDSVAAATEAGRAHGIEVVSPARQTRPARPWLPQPVEFGALAAQARRDWRELTAEQRDELLAMLQQRVTSIEQVRFLLDESPVENREIAALLAECAAEPVDDWPTPRLALATLMWCWNESGCVLQELNQTFISFAATALFLTRRLRSYRERLGETGPPPPATGGVLSLARQLGAVRPRIEQKYERCLHFDGSNWERREFLLPLPLYRRTDNVPQSLRDHLYDVIGVELPHYGTDYLDAWDRLLERALEVGTTPSRVIQELAHWAANTDDLWVDLAIFTVPIGTKLDTPWTMEFTDLFCYTGFRDGFDSEALGVPLDRVGVQNVVGQRMRYNAVKKAQNYAPVRRFPPQGFNLPDIAIAEDANHAGHYASGIRLACRVPITITYRDREWNGLSDVRLNRAVYRRSNRFLPRDLVVAHRYAQWSKGVADATYRRGLRFDAKWGNKVKDMDI